MEDLHKIWSHRWVSPKAKEGMSNINRHGLIAVEDIPAGEAVIVYGGVIIHGDDIAKFRQMFGDYDLPIDDNFSIAPTSKDEITKTGSVNHSCEPTLGWKNNPMLVTIRDVKAGEELAPDYAMHGGYPAEMTCNCGSASCRQVIRPDDWKNPALRQKYGQWFLPFLKEKIAIEQATFEVNPASVQQIPTDVEP
ncbi:MAG TPA: SET domain-containing protein-lysine N-methyltransferase [Candidatus Saccharimonadales bacterium]|nr:SET domain-containing protein-lysine N-methyltransferase [Candidatus Saccharimonadales bacterium]